MDRILMPVFNSSLVETAIMAKWTLHKAWTYCLNTLDDRCKKELITQAQKISLQGMYTAFFLQSYYTSMKTKPDIDKLLKNCSRMLSMLKQLDEKVWARFILENLEIPESV